MSIHIEPVNLTCHLFSSPLCDELPLLQKIANVVFHILTLGIPLVIYYFVTWCFPRLTSEQDENKDFIADAINSVKTDPLLGEKALAFAREKLAENPQIIPRQFSMGSYGIEGTHQPTNKEIALLTTFFWASLHANLVNLIEQNGENAWSEPDVISTADACMKVGYAISVLTLEDLEPFTNNLSTKGEKRTYVEALTSQDSYLHRTFFVCTKMYHWARGGYIWKKEEDGLFPQPTPPAYSTLFYTPGTVQNSWAKIYNTFCDRINAYVEEGELEKTDNRFFTSTRKDVGPETSYDHDLDT